MMRILAPTLEDGGCFRLDKNPVTGKLVGVLYGAGKPQTRDEKRWETESCDLPTITEESLADWSAAMGLFGAQSMELRKIDICNLETTPILETLRIRMSVRGYTDATRFRPDKFHLVHETTLRLQIPIVEDYSVKYDAYIQERFGISSHRLREQSLRVAFLLAHTKGGVVEIAEWGTWTEEQQETTLRRLWFVESRIKLL